MEDVVNRLARELSEAIAAAIADSPEVEAVRERARHAGFEMKVSLEAVIGFASGTERAKFNPLPLPKSAGRAEIKTARTAFSANDRRFLHSLRIAAEESNNAVD